MSPHDPAAMVLRKSELKHMTKHRSHRLEPAVRGSLPLGGRGFRLPPFSLWYFGKRPVAAISQIERISVQKAWGIFRIILQVHWLSGAPRASVRRDQALRSGLLFQVTKAIIFRRRE
ncbi:MAG: hypothetical protein QOJ42_4880 [Acidobacteriaceae bacterium]|nr:hypothetical protein [Acidobacteriaceae bacterium]